jgi:hypothetical protein
VSGSTTVITPPEPLPIPRTASTTYRNLLARGLAPDEAANLTAFLAGLALGDRPWTLAQVTRLLFLRELARTGRVGGVDPRVH